MTRGLAFLALLGAAPVAAQTAPSPTATAAAGGRIETARTLVGKLNLDRTLDFQFSGLMPLVAANIVNGLQTASDAPKAIKDRLATSEGRRQVGVITSEEMLAAFRARYPAIAEAAAEEYRRNFSEDELKAIIVFYDSAAGKRLLALQPQLQQRLSEAGKAVGREAGMAAFPKIRARIQALDKAEGGQ
ncbi:DUF2059 domain-containing protein [Sphingomonas sp. CFBP8993]|uniref:DUF2059 domain-containing protein n=1 Tax=Sphingomonas sp. CFBP8993 TaxID=3096526 RepID=UPI002A6B5D48|nr:DUF2059 domain-containing protein [Sphingomonas sp. CFBP8993]MDY0959372.1 DUF2059 domain-containing protein [Sphingomonas sp. CFBP8993]